MDSYDAFRDYEHRVGRWWMLTGFALLLAVPTAICIRYDAWPPLTWVLKGLLGVAPIYWTVGTIEVLTYVPMLGTGGSYLGFFTGNLTSLKVPCALNAMQSAGVEPGTDKYDAIANSNIIKTLQNAFGVEDLSKADLQKGAKDYMKAIGLTDAEITDLMVNLGYVAPVERPADGYRHAGAHHGGALPL